MQWRRVGKAALSARGRPRKKGWNVYTHKMPSNLTLGEEKQTKQQSRTSSAKRDGPAFLAVCILTLHFFFCGDFFLGVVASVRIICRCLLRCSPLPFSRWPRVVNLRNLIMLMCKFDSHSCFYSWLSAINTGASISPWWIIANVKFVRNFLAIQE